MTSLSATTYEIKDDDPFLKAMEWLLEPMKADIRNILKSHNDLKNDLKVDIMQMHQLREDNIILTNRLQKVEAQNKVLTKRVCTLEDRILQNNIIIHGIREGPWETEAIRQEKLYQAFSDTVLGRTFDERMETARTMYITRSRRIGKFRQMSSRPISVEMLYKSDADYLLNNRKYFSEGIYIDKEYSKETEAARKILHPYFKAARKMPKYQRKCRLDGNTLVLRGISYNIDTLHKLPEELQGHNISSSTNETCYGFFGSINPFSNFHPTEFNFEGKTFHSSKQLVQFKKAKFFKDEQCASQILASDTTLECKDIAKNISGFDYQAWNDNAKDQCKEGISAKFLSHSWLAEKLLSTGDKIIVECCCDKVWGTGVPLQEEDCLDRWKWESQGILGEILQEVWTQLKERLATTTTTTSGDSTSEDASQSLDPVTSPTEEPISTATSPSQQTMETS